MSRNSVHFNKRCENLQHSASNCDTWRSSTKSINHELIRILEVTLNFDCESLMQQAEHVDVVLPTKTSTLASSSLASKLPWGWKKKRMDLSGSVNA